MLIPAEQRSLKYLTSKSERLAIVKSSLDNVFDRIAFDCASKGEPSTKGEDGNTQSGRSEATKLHVLGANSISLGSLKG